MPKPIQHISEESIALIKLKIDDTIENGITIRSALADYSNSEAYDINWEVQAAVEALQVFGSRWTIEILSTLYIAGPRRFNEMKSLLEGISSRTLSDKLTLLSEEGLINRTVDEGPPVRVAYALSEHGIACGRLLSPLVAHLKIRSGSVQ
ncbi:MAG: helix-turn-helix domain-containing protein [Candidatus Thermoplasmatota archaeon]|nr:helix-turn-helix domain-containing protein [Candidatus Thermoplasmatota archaeon]MEC8541007.1 helix-turn-helix domain-containing protein [Candidatus Thermoplasmatota archaeon]